MRAILIFLVLVIIFQAHAQQTLKIGTLGFDPPFSLQIDNSGRSYGFEISLMDEICKRINAKCTYKSMQFAELFTGVEDGKIDLAIGSIIITKGRSEKFLFSIPYLVSKGSFVVLKKNHYKSIQELKNKTIGTLSGSLFIEIAQKELGQNISIKLYPHPHDLLFQLTNNGIDAFILDEKPSIYWVSNDNNLSLLGTPILTGGGYGIMAKLSDQELINRINKTILSMKNDGFLTNLNDQFF